ncbi:hypothetical protein EDB83DRAFT_2221343, partial [Lactarius deliciosus]
KQACSQELKDALLDIEKLLTSKKTQFIAGVNGLQSKCACSIQTCLHIVVNNKRHLINASKRAAESQGFAVKWGGRMVRQWVKIWIKSRELPKSKQGSHKKVFSLLDDPEVQTELCSYIQTNKWSMNPWKLSDLTKNKLIPDEAKKYLCNVVEIEMPTSLKNYLELELLPCIQMKVSKGVSLQTARRWLHKEGHMSWVLDGEQPLKKKGVGQGLHQLDVICSTKGWLPEASQTLEYGKNYDRYWNGELFVKQLAERIIPAFERAYSPSYQALIMVDNSQGHSAYSVDALLTSRMNMKPGGKQAKMQDGWHVQNSVQVAQKMCFPSDHAKFPGEPKGMRQVLMERGLWRDKLVMKCGSRSKKRDNGPEPVARCRSGVTDCCAKHILDSQPNFMEQKSLVQEVIDKAGHLCVFLPKFHCELNFIKFFWGTVK